MLPNYSIARKTAPRIVRLLLGALAISVLTALSQPPAPTPGKVTQAEQKKTSGEAAKPDADNKATEKSPTSVDKEAAKRQTGKEDKAGNENTEQTTAGDRVDSEILEKLPDYVLAIFTIVLAGVSYLQWRTMKGHAKALDAMACQMKAGLAETKKAADAAVLNARALISAERPWLLVSIVRKESDNLGQPGRYVVQAYNAGRTPAELVEGHCAVGKHPVEFQGPPGEIQDPFLLPMQHLIVNRDSFVIREFVPENMIGDEERQGTTFQSLFIYGRIDYWDIFKDRFTPGAKPYETRWLFRYEPSTRTFTRCAGSYARNS